MVKWRCKPGDRQSSAPGGPLGADQDGQPSLVAGRNAGQVDDQRAGAAMKHVDQAFPQFLGGREVERTAQPDDTAAGPDGSGTADRGGDARPDDPRPPAARGRGARAGSVAPGEDRGKQPGRHAGEPAEPNDAIARRIADPYS